MKRETAYLLLPVDEPKEHIDIYMDTKGHTTAVRPSRLKAAVFRPNCPLQGCSYLSPVKNRGFFFQGSSN
jgi:hypothetical protein